MATEELKFGPGGIHVALTHTVEFGSTWIDGASHEDMWSTFTDVFCESCTWSSAPSLPVARLSFLYGVKKEPQHLNFGTWLKKAAVNRAFVRITFTADNPFDPRRWWGVLDINADQMGGITPDGGDFSVAFGVQQFVAYGLEKLLVDHKVRDSLWGASAEVTKRPLVFNLGGEKNRTTAKVGSSYVFEPDKTAADAWSSRDIVEYLLENQTPANQSDSIIVPFAFRTGADANIPDWDRPELSQEDSTTYSLINRVADRRRLLTWHLEVSGTGVVEMVTATMTPTVINLTGLPGAPTVPANANVRNLDFDEDQLTKATLKNTTVDQYDQVVALGGFRRSVGSFSIDADSTLAEAWLAAAGDDYDEAGEADGYPVGAGTKQKQEIDIEFRGKPKFEDVYALFRIPRTWDRKVGDGEGGTKVPFFVDDDTPTDAYPVFYGQMYVEQTMPLFPGVDYLPATPDESNKGDFELAPIVYFKVPASVPAKFKRGDKMGREASLEVLKDNEDNFSVFVTVPVNTQTIRLNVHGSHQHAIAKDIFTRRDHDVEISGYSFRDMVITMSVTDDRRLEGVYPATPLSDDAVRRKYIRAGDSYTKIHICPGTVLELNSEGGLERAVGADIVRPDDADDILDAIAQVAASWYTTAHQQMTLDTARMFGPLSLQLGDLVGTIGSAAYSGSHLTTINAPITEIEITSQRGNAQSQPAPMFRMRTFAGELDALQFVTLGIDPIVIEGEDSVAFARRVLGIIPPGESD